MSPEFLPEAALLLVGVLAAAVALRLLFARRLGPALRAGAVGIACIVFAFLLEGTHRSARWNRAADSRRARHPVALLPAGQDSIEKDSEQPPSMSLLLGDVLLRVAPSGRYVLSVDGKQFLEIGSLRSGLIVSCEVASNDGLAARVNQNGFVYHRYGIQTGKPDPHTLLLRQGGEDIFRVRYAEPHKVVVFGQFQTSGSREPILISANEGIHWGGGGVPPGTTIDLASQGEGRINFERSGLIRVLP